MIKYALVIVLVFGFLAVPVGAESSALSATEFSLIIDKLQNIINQLAALALSVKAPTSLTIPGSATPLPDEQPPSLLLDFVSASATNDGASSGCAGCDDTGTYRIIFDATAYGDDIFVDGDLLQFSGVAGVDGTQWATTSTSTGRVSIVQQTLIANGSDPDDVTTSGALSYQVEQNETRRLTLTVALQAQIDSLVGVRLTGVKWDIDSNDNHANINNSNLGQFKTNVIFLNQT